MADNLEHSGIVILKEEPMAKHTTFKIGGPAAMLAEARDIRELVSLVYMAKKNNFRYIVIGNGSDLLFPDEGYRGLVIKTTPQFSGIYAEENGIIRAEAGALLSQVANFAAEHSLAGMEFAQGIPGTIGGALYMNAGAYGGEIGNLVLRTCIMDGKGELHMISREEHSFAYRDSIFKHQHDYVALYTEIQLTQGKQEEIRAKMADYSARRRASQPLDMPSAGSAFKRPQDAYAAQLIEECGLKGFAMGGAQVSEKHAGFIINTGNATCADVIAVLEHIEKTVFEQKHIKLEREIQVI